MQEPTTDTIYGEIVHWRDIAELEKDLLGDPDAKGCNLQHSIESGHTISCDHVIDTPRMRDTCDLYIFNCKKRFS